MKTQALHRIRRSTWGKKVFVYFSLFAMLYQYTLSAYATALSTATIQTDFASNPLFNVASSSAAYKYVGNPYMEQSAPFASNLATFYNKLETDLRPNLGKPTFVPIDVSGITVFIPTYEKPRLIGSPLVQSRYVRYQVQNLLGRNLINSDVSAYATEAAQLNTLYENALDYIRYENSDVVYGESLNLDQANSGLAKDIVWPEFRVINGEKVVVPVVYLTETTYRERKITSHKSQFNGTTQFNNLTINEVEVKLGREAFLEIAGDLNNNRGIINASGDAQIAISGALNNFSGTISAQGNLTIGAHSINNETIVHRYDFGLNQSGRFGEVASINSVTGNVVLRSYSDILIQGGIVDAAGEITFAADGNIFIGPVQYTEHRENSGHGWGSSLTQTEILQSRLTAEQTIKLIAQEAIKIDAAEIISDKGHIELLANLGITIEDEQKQYQYSSHNSWRNTDSNTSAYKTVAMRSVLDAGKGIRIHTDFGDITMRAADITSQTGTTVNAENGSVNLLLTKETDHYSYSSVTKDLFTIESISRGHNIETAVHNTIVGGFHVEALNGLNVQYEGIKDGTFEDQIENFRNIDGLAWMAELKDQVSADPNVQIDWDAVETVYEEWSEKNRSLSPAAMAVIMIVVAVCTAGAGTAAAGAVATQGGTAYAAISAGVNAMITTAASASISTTVNGGNFKDVFESGYEAVLSENGMKNIAVAMVTAGAIAKLDAQFFNATKLGDSSALTSTREITVKGVTQSVPSLSLTGQALQAATHSVVQGGIRSFVDGIDFSDFGKNFRAALTQNSIDLIGQNLSTKIGDAARADPPQITVASQYIAHAAVGCITGALTSDSAESTSVSQGCASGAGGAVIGEFVSAQHRQELNDNVAAWAEEHLGKLGEYTYEKYHETLIDFVNRGVDLGRLSAAIAAFALGGDVNIAGTAAENAARYNQNGDLQALLSHKQFSMVQQAQWRSGNPGSALILDSLSTSLNRIARLMSGQGLDVNSNTFFRDEFNKYPSLSNALSAALEQGMNNPDLNIKAYLATVILDVSASFQEYYSNRAEVEVNQNGSIDIDSYSLDADKRSLLNAIEEIRYYEKKRVESVQKNNEFGNGHFSELIEKRFIDVANVIAANPSLRMAINDINTNIPGYSSPDLGVPNNTELIPPDIERIITFVFPVSDQVVELATSPGYEPHEFGSTIYGFPIIEQNPKELMDFNAVHEKYKDKILPGRIDHILDGDGPTSGGHRPGLGVPGKTEFPAGWSDDKIIGAIVDIATDPNSKAIQVTGGSGEYYVKDLPKGVTTKKGWPVRYKIESELEGVMIKVIIEPDGQGIITGYPVSGPGVIKNPEL